MWGYLRAFILIVFDAVLVNMSLFVAFYLRFFEEGIPTLYYETFLNIFMPSTLLYLTSFYLFKLYKRVWSYASTGELLSVVYSVSSGALGTIAASFFLRSQLPRSVIVMAWAFTIILVGGSRFAWRLYIERKRGNGVKQGRKALIVGAGDAGAMVARELYKNPHIDIRPVAFIDDDPSKKNLSLLGIPVVGNRQDIPALVTRKAIDEIIIAMPSAGGQSIKEMVEICRSTGVETKILPGVYEIIDGTVSIDRIRPVQLEDLLGRDPIKVDLEGISAYLRDKVVLVTGAGGSIGSELCRQVASFEPWRLVILGHGENSIYKIWNELKDSFPHVDLEVEIADIRDFQRINYIFNKHRPGVVFHAAAHKHVPLMEMHPVEALKTNVFGTRNVAQAAHNVGTNIFILISTDKAVNPSSVMGASKLLAEVLIRQLNNLSNTVFSAVRFGNVLGSNGSVVPLFERQIRQGGPVTVTHPEMKRYFMTIPEAVSLVIQAGAMANGGEVFVLDMGHPVKIMDLARDMIKLSGYEPEKDIEIIFTGIRPGEKLHEELFTAEEDASATCHSKIFIARPCQVDAVALEKELLCLEQLNDSVTGERVLETLKRVIPGIVYYNQQLNHYEVSEDLLTVV